MPRPRTAKTTRSHHKKPAAPPAPELEALVDTIADGINPDDIPFDEQKTAKPRAQKPGPKKVLSETSKMFGDGVSAVVLMATSQADTRKNLTKEEAESIGHPIVRMVGRRLPDFLKPYLPKAKMSPEDAADIEEIVATFAKWGVRLLSIFVADFFASRDKAQAAKQQAQAKNGAAPQPATNPAWEAAQRVAAQEMKVPAPEAVPVQNGHNPAFDILNSVDLGVEAN